MTRRMRLVANILAWAAFITIAPFLISYSMGHKITPSLPNPVPVGAFLVRSFPSEATLYINDQQINNKTPTSVNNLLAGNYRVTLKKNAYRTWQKTLPIVGTKITDIRNVRLIPETIEEDILRGNVLDFFVSPKRQWLAVVEQTARGKQVRVVSLKNFSEPGTVIKTAFGKKEKAELIWSPDENQIVLSLQLENGNKNFLVQRATGKVEKIGDEKTKVIGWVSTLTEQRIIEMKGTQIFIAPSTETTKPEVISEVATLAASNQDEFIILENPKIGDAIIKIYSSSGKNQDALYLPEMNGDQVGKITLSSAGDIAIETRDQHKLFIWDKTERAWHFISDSVFNSRFSPEGNKVLWQESEFDVWAMNLHEKRTILTPYTPELVARLSNTIRNPIWYAGSNHVIFFEKDVIKIAEVDHRDGHRIENLISTNRGDGRTEIIEDGNIILATVQRKEGFVLSRFFMLTALDR